MISKNREAFGEDGAVTRCMKDLGEVLMQQGLAQMQNTPHDWATEQFGGQMPEGLEHLPGQVDNSMRSAATEAYTMGEEFQWLSVVLPAAARADYEPFNRQETATRQAMLAQLGALQSLCQTDSEVCTTFQSELTKIAGVVEEAMFNLVTGRY